MESFKDIMDRRKKLQADRKAAFNEAIGRRLKQGYIFIDSNPAVHMATFWYHNNSHLQDDMVIVEMTLDDNNMPIERRVLIERSKFVAVAKEVEHVESKYKK